MVGCCMAAPPFSVQRSKNTCSKGFWNLWTENRGAPKTRHPTTTDPTPPPFSALWELGRNQVGIRSNQVQGEGFRGVGAGLVGVAV